jgi:hypothetical protein
MSTKPVVTSSEMSVKLYQTAQRRTPRDHRIIDIICVYDNARILPFMLMFH